ncbi:MAG: hypothetical protein OHK0053_37650 [Microscillaceae bacterium]
MMLPNILIIEKSDELAKALIASNYASERTKVCKAYIIKNERVWLSFESYIPKPQDFKQIFTRALSAMQTCLNHFKEKYNQ